MPIHKIEKFSFKDITLAYEAFKKISNVSECLIIQNAFRVEVCQYPEVAGKAHVTAV